MSNLPKTPQKRKSQCKKIDFSVRETNNNSKPQLSKQESARNFIVWFKCKIDNDCNNLSSYLADDVTLEWFGRTIKTRKKVSGFVKTEIQCSRHDFTTVESINRIQTRNERHSRKDNTAMLSSPHSPEVDKYKIQKTKKRKLHSTCHSPQWADGCEANEESEPIEKKRKLVQNDIKEISNKGDGMTNRSNNSSITPPNMECGQGDCLPSTSGTNPETVPDTLHQPLPKLAVECNGYIELTRTKNNWSADSVKWDRKCKVQISYSEDPLNVGDYIIWNLRYSDESKCRRNLLSAFDEGASELDGIHYSLRYDNKVKHRCVGEGQRMRLKLSYLPNLDE